MALAVAVLARVAVKRILAKVGHAGAPLDDAYIHFQYARAIAEGHPFHFQAGEPATSGATSLLWPALLAPFWLVGFRDDAILWPAWALSFVALGALAFEAWAITRRLAGDAAAVGAAALVVVFPPFTWFAASGMEVVPFAWLLARSVRRASEWAEAERDERTTKRAIELAALAWATTLMRPEGALAAILLASVLAACPRDKTIGSRAFGLAALLPLAAQPLLLWAVTGAARSTTAAVKLLPGNPYYPGAALTAAIAANAQQLASNLLDGGYYSVEFLPTGGAWAAFAGLGAIAVAGVRSKRIARALFAVGLGLAILVPCAYVTFLWNRLRYLWPFATAWLVGLACLARVVGDVVEAVDPRVRRARMVGPLVCGAFVGMFFMRLDWTIDDLAQSVSGIDRQQVALGRWAETALPDGARIGLNDTGAIAYFSNHHTFDIVGLTTQGEGRYWVAGVGSRLEHYERLHAADPAAFPTHFIVYPQWFGIPPLLGQELEEATVTDASILGGQTMGAYRADVSYLGSGEAPWSDAGPVADALDVADLESEAAHGYELLGARDGEEIAGAGPTPKGPLILDGGRTRRTQERFVAHLPAGKRIRALVRLEAAATAHVRVAAGGREVASFTVEPPRWTEEAFDIPEANASTATPIELRADGAGVTTFHYWFTESPLTAQE
jgi:hypothetical protein